jgi:ribosome biogenesis GTPase / thiamine phosphate phosphatase
MGGHAHGFFICKEEIALTDPFYGPRLPDAASQTGLVLRAEGSLFHVLTPDGEVPCTLRGRLKRDWLRVTSLVVAGDLVTISRTPDGAAIEGVLERRTALSRPGFHGYEHVVAANADQLLIVASTHQPPYRGHLVDRFLLHSRSCGLQPLLVVNKCDLADERTIRAWTAPVAAAGVPVLLTNAVTGDGVAELARTLAGKISVLSGQSGVGKSTLLNAIAPAVAARVGAVNTHGRGGHTTSASRLYPLPFGGWLVDTPGIRELSLWEAEPGAAADLFPEIEELAAGCRFRDCRHEKEPGCAVKAALRAGKLSADRLRSFQKLGREPGARRPERPGKRSALWLTPPRQSGRR